VFSKRVNSVQALHRSIGITNIPHSFSRITPYSDVAGVAIEEDTDTAGGVPMKQVSDG
jgi:hypothetical protein